MERNTTREAWKIEERRGVCWDHGANHRTASRLETLFRLALATQAKKVASRIARALGVLGMSQIGRAGGAAGRPQATYRQRGGMAGVWFYEIWNSYLCFLLRNPSENLLFLVQSAIHPIVRPAQ